MAWRLVLILLLVSNSINANEYSCIQAQITEAPFYVSDEYKQGDRLYENLRSVDEPSKIEHYLPRETLVKVEPELFEYSDHPSYRLPIRVISTPSEKREESAKGVSGRGQKKRFLHTMKGIKGLKRAEKGTEGFVHKKSLRKVSEYVFVLKGDAPLFKTPGNIDQYSMSLSFDMTDDLFNVERCCLKDDEETCFDKYKIKIKDSFGNEVANEYMHVDGCGMFDHVEPIRKDIADSVLPVLRKVRDQQGFWGHTVGDLELLSPHQTWKRSDSDEVRPTLSKFPLNSEGLGPFNTYHYKPDDKLNSDAYLLPATQCAFLSALEEFNKNCDEDNPGCLVQIGNMYHHKNWNVHVSHWTGMCIDVRPLRTDVVGDYSNGLTYRSRAYSRERTTKFINALFKAGADPVIFNDRKIKASKRVLRDSKGIHDNHIHFCFKPNSKIVKQACD